MASYVSSVGARRLLLALAATVLVGTALGAGQNPGAQPAAGSPPAAPDPPHKPLQPRHPPPSSSSKRVSVRCSPPTVSRATANRRWAACASTRARGCFKGGEAGPALVPGEPGEQHAAEGPAARRRLPAHAARPGQAAGGRHRGGGRVGQRWAPSGPARRETTAAAPPARREGHHAGAASVLVVPAAGQPRGARGARHRMAADRHRSLHPRAAGKRRTAPGRARRQAHAAAPRDARPDRACRRRRRRWTRSSPTSRPTHSRRWSIGCSPRRATARPGAASGSTSPATARTTTAASTRWAAASTPIPTRTCIATG